MSTLYLRGKKKQSVWIGFTDQFGRYHRRPLGIQSLNGKIPAEATRLKQKIDLEIANHTWGMKNDIPRVHLKELSEQFCSFMKGNRHPGTIYLYKLAMDHLIDFVGNIPIAMVDQDMIKNFRDHLIKKKSSAKASQTLRSLSPMFRWAMEEQGWIPKMPINRYNSLIIKRKPPVTWSDDDLAGLIRWCNAKGKKHFLEQIQFLLLTGFRSNESCSITWDKVDMQNKVLYHYDDKQDEWKPYPIDNVLRRFILQLSKNGKYLFHYRSIHSLNKIIIQARKDNAVRKELKIHSFKSTYIRHLIAGGLSTAEIHKLAHHKSYATTDYYYSTFQMKHLRKALTKSRKREI